MTNPEGWRARVALVLSGKGGVGKSMWQRLLAGEASRRGLRTLLIDADPECNLSRRCGVKAHATGFGDVLDAAGVGRDDVYVEAGAKRFREEIQELDWPGVDLVPAGARLLGMSQVAIPELRLLRAVVEDAGALDDYDLILVDSGGRAGSLVSALMYMSDVAYAPIFTTQDAITKALEARKRVQRLQEAWPLRWAGVVLTGFDGRSGDYVNEVYRTALHTFDGEVRADLPARAVITEAYGLGTRLGDRRDVPSQGFARVLEGFLMRDLLQAPGWPTGILR